jgi:hypothetical protein
MCEIANLSHEIINLSCVSESLSHQICKATHAFCQWLAANVDFIRKNRDELKNLVPGLLNSNEKYKPNSSHERHDSQKSSPTISKFACIRISMRLLYPIFAKHEESGGL